MALRDEQRITVKEEVLSRVIDGEALLLDLRSGTYFGLNDSGSVIWELISRGTTVAEMRNRVLEAFDVDRETLDQELERLLDELTTRGLVDLSG